MTIRKLALSCTAATLLATAAWAGFPRSGMNTLRDLGAQLDDVNTQLMAADGESAPALASAARTHISRAQSFVRGTLADLTTAPLDPNDLALYAECVTDLLGALEELDRTAEMAGFPQVASQARSAAAGLRATVRRQVARDARLFDAVLSAPGGHRWDAAALQAQTR